jgi:hypothetical protein
MGRSGRQNERRFVGDLVLNPVAVVFLVVLVANDQLAKRSFHNAITGKLSDVAGLALFPLVVVAMFEAARRIVIGIRWPLRQHVLLGVIVATGLVFTIVKVWPPAGALYRSAYSVAQWPLDLPGSMLWGGDLPGLRTVVLARDSTDLLALPALAIAWLIGRRVMARPSDVDERESAPA